MCPLCITAGTLYLASAGAGSAGGLAAVAAKVIRRRRRGKSTPVGTAAVLTRRELAPRSSRR